MTQHTVMTYNLIPRGQTVRIGYSRKSDDSVSSSVWGDTSLRADYITELMLDTDVSGVWFRDDHNRVFYLKRDGRPVELVSEVIDAARREYGENFTSLSLTILIDRYVPGSYAYKTSFRGLVFQTLGWA